MKKLIGTTAVLMSVVGLPATIINFMNGHYIFGAICLIWFGAVILFVGDWVLSTMKIKSFTMIELLAVITIASILLTLTFGAFRVDRQKFDSLQIKNELNKVYHASLVYGDGPLLFDPDLSQYVSDIEFSHPDLYFDKGAPVDIDGRAIIGYKIIVSDKKGVKKDMSLFVRPFTGNITFNQVTE